MLQGHVFAGLPQDFVVSDQMGNFNRPGTVIFLEKDGSGRWHYQEAGDLTRDNVERLKIDFSRSMPTIYLDAPYLGRKGEQRHVGESYQKLGCLKGEGDSPTRKNGGYSVCNSEFTKMSSQTGDVAKSILLSPITMLLGSVGYSVKVDQDKIHIAIVESDAINESTKAMANAMADQVPGLDGELLAAVRSTNFTKIEDILAEGANPNIVLCSLPPVNYRIRYSVYESTKCGSPENLYDVMNDNNILYEKQITMIDILGKHGEKFDNNSDGVIFRLAGPTIMSMENQNPGAYVPDKILVAKALIKYGFKFDSNSIKKSAARFEELRNSDALAVVKSIAELTGDTDAFESGILPVIEQNRKQALKEQENSLKEQENSLTMLRLVKTVGQKICRTIDGTSQDYIGTSLGKPIFGNKYNQKFYITAFTENSVGDRIQLRVSGVRRKDGDEFVNIDHIDGDTVIQPNSVIWDDPSQWEPCY